MNSEIPVPRYYQIVHQLEKFIQDNNCAPGEKLPSEKELQLSFGVSRITARRAFEEMERRGLVTKQRGKGTYVAKQLDGPKFPKFTGSIDDLFMIGRGGVVKEATTDEVPATARIREALGLTEQPASVVRIQRVLLLHERPYAYHQNFYPTWIGNKIQREDLLKYPLLEILERKLHIPVLKVDQVIEATLADTEIANRLGISFGAPLFYVERTLYGEKIPVGFTQAYYRGDGYRLSVTLVKTNIRGLKRWRSPTPAG
ncbi:MAG: GntR family transcriptional regulator [Deltaproteobacteria bacterium]|nr:GntR family transcriptional regulator [Deltaproteobacteria bacterium]